jgi:hypothetical protein
MLAYCFLLSAKPLFWVTFWPLSLEASELWRRDWIKETKGVVWRNVRVPAIVYV